MFNRGLIAASTAEALTHTREPLSQAVDSGVLDVEGVAVVVVVAIIMFPSMSKEDECEAVAMVGLILLLRCCENWEFLGCNESKTGDERSV